MSDTGDLNLMDLAEFRNIGYLQEANLQTGVHINIDAIEAVLVGEPIGNEWPVVVRTSTGSDYVDHQAADAASAHLAVDLLVSDLTNPQPAKAGDTAECVHCGTALKYVPGVEWVHVLRHASPARNGCVRPVPKHPPSPLDNELADLLNGDNNGGGA